MLHYARGHYAIGRKEREKDYYGEREREQLHWREGGRR